MSGVSHITTDSKKLGDMSSSGAVPPFTSGGAGIPAGGVASWKASTAYLLNALVTNAGWLFQCSVAGASAAEVAAPAQAGPTPNALVDNAATWTLVGPVSSFCVVDATAQQELGFTIEGRDSSVHTYGLAEFMYVKFTAAIPAPGDFCIVDRADNTCVQAPAATLGASKYSTVGICMGKPTAGSPFGWVMIRGVHDWANTTAAGFAAGTILAGSGTAGRFLSSAQTANYLIDGATHRSAGIAGNGTVELYWPSCSGR
jgi:hypothetical protein